MGKYLSIIIPRYLESEECISYLLWSIKNQCGVNFNDVEVVIVNDGTSAYSDQFVQLFLNINLRLVNIEQNVGPGMCREHGINSTDSTYFMFCDADDILFDSLTINKLLEYTVRKPDVIYSNWLEESNDNGVSVYREHKNDITWMHGKIYRREFINNNDIHFDKDLRIQEDTYFNGLCFELSLLTIYHEYPTYVWKCNRDSITRKNNSEFTYTGFSTFIESFTKSFEKLLSKGRKDNIDLKLNLVILYSYFTLLTPLFQTCDKKYVILIEDRIRYLLKKYNKLIESISLDDFSELYFSQKNKVMKDNTFSLPEKYSEFVKRIKGL